MALLLGWLIAWALLVPFLSGFGTDHPTPAGRVLGALVAVALLLTAGQLCLRGGVTLTPDRLRVNGLRRDTAVRWAEVAAITVEPRLSGRRVVLTDVRGRRIRLAAPRVGLLLWDRGFEVKLELLRRFWRAHRGADWAPTPAPAAGQSPAPREPDRYQGPRAWQQLLVVAWCSLTGCGLLLWAFVGLLLASD